MNGAVGFNPYDNIKPIEGGTYKGVLDMEKGILYSEPINPKMPEEVLDDLLNDLHKDGKLIN